MSTFAIGVMIFFYSIAQSVFGVGILLIGTPTLLIFGYSYFSILGILLPISLMVSLLQLWELRSAIDKKFIAGILFFAVPLIPVGMFFSSWGSGYLGIVIGMVLLGVCSGKIRLNDKHLNINFLILGFIHGLTNLGGAILPSLTFSACQRKHLANISCSYSILASIQLLTLYVIDPAAIGGNFHVEIVFILIGLIGSRLVGKKILLKIDAKKYSWALRIYIGLIGSYLILKNL